MLKINSFDECKVVGDLFTAGIPEIDNDPHIKELKEEILKTRKQIKSKSVYVVRFEDGIIKVGVSKNPDKRIKTIERNSGRVSKDKYITKQINNSFQIEAKIKKKFKDNNIKGEFYNLDFGNVVYFVNKFLKEVV